MGARGPKPLPSAIKQARGTYRADRAMNEAAPIGKPVCPSWIADADARKEFRRVVKLLTAMGLIGAADQNLVLRYCLTWSRYKRMITALSSNPGAEFATFKDEAGKVKAIQVSALNTSARGLASELSQCEASLGMSPSARSRINIAPAPVANPSDDIDQFFSPRIAS